MARIILRSQKGKVNVEAILLMTNTTFVVFLKLAKKLTAKKSVYCFYPVSDMQFLINMIHMFPYGLSAKK